jgi:hypothetical protein
VFQRHSGMPLVAALSARLAGSWLGSRNIQKFLELVAVQR